MVDDVRCVMVFALLVLGLQLCSTTSGDVRLPALLSDNMVLQRDAPVPVWGWAEPGEEVTVSIAGQSQSAEADSAGSWRVTLDPLQAGGPHEMTVRGRSIITVSNVLVGEVWVGSGQSNMEVPVKLAMDAQKEIAAADYPEIRLFTVDRTPSLKPRQDVVGKWGACSGETVPDFSAVMYYFGRKLRGELGVPIGLVHSSWGGTIGQAWMSRQALESVPACKPNADQLQKQIDEYPDLVERFADYHKEWQAKIQPFEAAWHNWYVQALELEKAGKPVPPAPPIPPIPGGRNTPTCLYNGMIRPLMPFAVRGVIWYQGEGNAGAAEQYRTLFPALIRSWRKDWGQGDFPFLFVQLANFKPIKDEPTESAWAELREAQLLTLSAVPNTGMAVAIDIGDVWNIHPLNKQDVGKRLALGALALAYSRDIVCSGPIYARMSREGSGIRLHFTHVGGGLVTKGDERLKGFAISGADGEFVWADAVIDGDTVVVRSDRVTAPADVRYAWADNPVCNLYNKAGLPASPFRTDGPLGSASYDE